MCYTVLYRYPLLWARAADRGGHEATGAMPAWKAVVLRQAGPIPVPAVPVPISTHPKKQYNLTTTVKKNSILYRGATQLADAQSRIFRRLSQNTKRNRIF